MSCIPINQFQYTQAGLGIHPGHASLTPFSFIASNQEDQKNTTITVLLSTGVG